MFSWSYLLEITPMVNNCSDVAKNLMVCNQDIQLFLNLFQVNLSLLHISQYFNFRVQFDRIVIV
jgi:hypothetical protein